MINLKFVSALASVTLAAQMPTAQAAVIPFGVHNDVSVATVTGTWGWTQIWRGTYWGSADFDTMFAGAGSHVLVAGFKAGSNSQLEVLAATTLTDALAYTGLNATKLSNGARWYSNAYSFGFAGADDVINQNSADIAGGQERDRLSWHTSYLPANQQWQQDSTKPAESIFFGYRHGSQYSGDRVIFTLSQIGAVPEPSTWAMLILGFGIVGGTMRRRFAMAQTSRTKLTYA